MRRLSTLLLAAGALVAASSCDGITTRSVVRNLLFPDAPPRVRRAWDLSTAAVVTPTLLVGYHDTAHAAQCIAAITGANDAHATAADGGLDALFKFGQCVAAPDASETRPDAVDRWRSCFCKYVFPLAPAGSVRLRCLPPNAAVSAPPTNATPAPSADPAAPATPTAPIAPSTPSPTPPPTACDAPARAPAPINAALAPCAALAPADLQTALLALADTGEALFRYQQSLFRNDAHGAGPTPENGTLAQEVRAGAVMGVRQVVSLLCADPGSRDPNATDAAPNSCTGAARHTHRSHLPMLALSGGAANGAFTAGYLHALLRLREEAYAQGGAAAGEIERTNRFGGATGTSVGSVIAGLIDLYFAPRDASSSRQSAALRMLVDEFTRLSEWDLLCLEPGDAAQLAGEPRAQSIPNVLRFRPMRARMERIFDEQGQGDAMLDNDFVRVSMAVEQLQNVVMGLDERACRTLLGADRRRCFTQGIIASVVEPVLAEPIDRVWSGLRGARGEAGRWYDGGLRSGTPTLRALLMTDGFSFAHDQGDADDHNQIYVLAINTHRAEGIPRHPSELSNGLQVVFSALGALADQTRRWEQDFTRLYAVQRADRIRSIRCSSTDAGPRGVASDRQFEQLSAHATDAVLSVFVPDDAADHLSASGYTFDPSAMTGLFLVGEEVFAREADEVLRRLGWDATEAYVTRGQDSALDRMRCDIAARRRRYDAWITQAGMRTQLLQARRRGYDACMRYCGESQATDAQCAMPQLQPCLDEYRPPTHAASCAAINRTVDLPRTEACRRAPGR